MTKTELNKKTKKELIKIIEELNCSNKNKKDTFIYTMLHNNLHRILIAISSLKRENHLIRDCASELDVEADYIMHDIKGIENTKLIEYVNELYTKINEIRGGEHNKSTIALYEFIELKKLVKEELFKLITLDIVDEYEVSERCEDEITQYAEGFDTEEDESEDSLLTYEFLLGNGEEIDAYVESVKNDYDKLQEIAYKLTKIEFIKYYIDAMFD